MKKVILDGVSITVYTKYRMQICYHNQLNSSFSYFHFNLIELVQ